MTKYRLRLTMESEDEGLLIAIKNAIDPPGVKITNKYLYEVPEETNFDRLFKEFVQRCANGHYEDDQCILEYAPDRLVFEYAMEQSDMFPDLSGTIYSEASYSDCYEGMGAWYKFCREKNLHGLSVKQVNEGSF